MILIDFSAVWIQGEAVFRKNHYKSEYEKSTLVITLLYNTAILHFSSQSLRKDMHQTFIQSYIKLELIASITKVCNFDFVCVCHSHTYSLVCEHLVANVLRTFQYRNP